MALTSNEGNIDTMYDLQTLRRINDKAAEDEARESLDINIEAAERLERAGLPAFGKVRLETLRLLREHNCEDSIDTDTEDGWVLKSTADEELDRVTRQRDALADFLRTEARNKLFRSTDPRIPLQVAEDLRNAGLDLRNAIADLTGEPVD